MQWNFSSDSHRLPESSWKELMMWRTTFREFIHRVVTGYLPSAILILFLYAVPPTMMFSAMEGNISRSQRKRSACIKVLYNMGIPYFTLKLES
ncbi:hypothetical protein ES319_D13G092900v1 [Gossypium barbadense]|uniref:CSC1/OSCA1-like 7TM region domain-containing protein n=2 Tax=Gossypium barbadense TaxID=3634 RepID=A0A5J5NNK5_GOSBA|nr:hypothetical protein ES319_D13G092900v1 [Gossypium barbadense]